MRNRRLSGIVSIDDGTKIGAYGYDTEQPGHLGHKNIAHTVRYTELAPDRFKTFWKD